MTTLDHRQATFELKAVDASALLVTMQKIKEYSYGNGIEDVTLDKDAMTFSFTVSRYAIWGGHNGWDYYTATFALHKLKSVSGAMGITPYSEYFILADEYFDLALDLADDAWDEFSAQDFAWQECDNYLREALGNLPTGEFVFDEMGRRWNIWFEGEIVKVHWIEKAEGVHIE